MAEHKHTPGPWFIDGDDIRAPDGDDDPWYVAEVITGCGPGDATPANARLIAAAPDLLEALKDAQKAIRELRDQGAPTAYWDDIEAANKAAISKATGESAA